MYLFSKRRVENTYILFPHQSGKYIHICTLSRLQSGFVGTRNFLTFYFQIGLKIHTSIFRQSGIYIHRCLLFLLQNGFKDARNFHTLPLQGGKYIHSISQSGRKTHTYMRSILLTKRFCGRLEFSYIHHWHRLEFAYIYGSNPLLMRFSRVFALPASVRKKECMNFPGQYLL